jgi:hypothetical protein
VAEFNVGDKVTMPGVPIVVEVLGFEGCDDEGCEREVFRFYDPETGVDDTMHCDEFVKVS